MRVYAFRIWFNNNTVAVHRILFGPNNILDKPYDGQYISCIAVQKEETANWWPKTYEEFEESIDKWKLKDLHLNQNVVIPFDKVKDLSLDF
jgi:hypothetical protein